MGSKKVNPETDALWHGESTYLSVMTEAEEFYAAYRVCKEEKGKTEINELKFMDPSAVLLSLACELYIKTIYALQHKVSKKSELLPGHKLLELYLNLDDLQVDVYQYFKEAYKEQSKNKKVYDMDSFKAELETYQDVFIKFRYSYEFGSRSINFLFLECLYLACKNVFDSKNEVPILGLRDSILN